MTNPDVRSVTLDRIESGRYTVRNQRGGEITVGSGNTSDFTPVELFLAALAGCSAIDLDLIVSKRSVPLEFSAVASGSKVRDELVLKVFRRGGFLR